MKSILKPLGYGCPLDCHSLERTARGEIDFTFKGGQLVVLISIADFSASPSFFSHSDITLVDILKDERGYWARLTSLLSWHDRHGSPQAEWLFLLRPYSAEFHKCLEIAGSRVYARIKVYATSWDVGYYEIHDLSLLDPKPPDEARRLQPIDVACRFQTGWFIEWTSL